MHRSFVRLNRLFVRLTVCNILKPFNRLRNFRPFKRFAHVCRHCFTSENFPPLMRLLCQKSNEYVLSNDSQRPATLGRQRSRCRVLVSFDSSMSQFGCVINYDYALLYRNFIRVVELTKPCNSK